MFWQQMDPLAVIRALGPAVHHVHLKDTQLVPDQVALAGVLDHRPFDDPANRPGCSGPSVAATTVRSGRRFVAALRDVGYDDVLSIENEDVTQPAVEGVEEAAAYMLDVLKE